MAFIHIYLFNTYILFYSLDCKLKKNVEKHIEEKKRIWTRPNRLTTKSYELYKVKYTKAIVSRKLLAWVDLPWISRRGI